MSAVHATGGRTPGAMAPVRVARWTHALGSLVERYPEWWRRLGDLETRIVSRVTPDTGIRAPIYIAGLPRCGSTLLLELLNAHRHTVTHKYRDFPMLFTPYFWNRLLDLNPLRDQPRRERSRDDGLLFAPHRPEAFEEVLWMAFFPDAHDPTRSAVMDAAVRHPEFECFYWEHIRKLLQVRGGSRYLSTASYNITRLEYLLRMFADARFVLPVRDPVWHIGSLMKQHRLMLREHRANPRARIQMRRAGHFEFGLDRRPINVGDAGAAQEIEELWAAGREVEGWARYWNAVHSFLADRLERNPSLRRAALVVDYDVLCEQPACTVATLLDHCRLPLSARLLERAQRRIRYPAYERPEFDARERRLIEDCTGATAARLGIEPDMRRIRATRLSIL